jgi:CRISPR-associated protein Csy1
MNLEKRDRWRTSLQGVIDGQLEKKAKAGKHEAEPSPWGEVHRNWIAAAAKNAAQLQLATHTIKPVHPDAKGSEFQLSAPICADTDVVGTHSLSAPQQDFTGNAAALGVVRLFKAKLNDAEQSFLSALIEGSPEAASALDDDPQTAQSIRAQLLAVTGQKLARTTHDLAKQVYFPLPNGDEHLLAPLYPTAVVHRVSEVVKRAKFSDVSMAGRKAKKDGKTAEPYRDYFDVLVQSFGGTKPQNISQLNSERGGKAYLLANKPPAFDAEFLTPPIHSRSVFDSNGAFARRTEVRKLVTELRRYLDGYARRPGNVEVRNERARLVSELIEQLFDFTSEVRSLASGWSLDEQGFPNPSCKLHFAQCRWLDPKAEPKNPPIFQDSDFDDDEPAHASDWVAHVGTQFGRWLNRSLETKKNRFYIPEFEEWNRLVQRAIRRFEREYGDD